MNVINLLMPHLAFPIPQDSVINTSIHFMLIIKAESQHEILCLFQLANVLSSNSVSLYDSKKMVPLLRDAQLAAAFQASLDSWLHLL